MTEFDREEIIRRSHGVDSNELIMVDSSVVSQEPASMTPSGSEEEEYGDFQSQRQKFSNALASLPKVSSSSIATSPLYGPNSREEQREEKEEEADQLGLSSTTTTTLRNPFRGLSNQGATCYMNSLLQTLYMTPEFRKGLYEWNWKKIQEESEEEFDEEDNIPFQLQKLFGQLQMTTTKESISTKALTKSFGWTGADVFQQHDVQELCRVLFDALEKCFKETINETLVNDLYQGSLKDYVKCCECGYESSRVDNFLDLSLVIRPFGSEKMMKSVEEAIELFLTPEVLNKENQWMCDRCKEKRDAIKGLKFSKLPYLLSLQLKRFDFDYTTMNRIKLHNEVTFPKYLDMNSYVQEEGGIKGKIARKMSMERHELEGKIQRKRMASSGSLAEEEEENDESEDETTTIGSSTSTMDTWKEDFDPQLLIKRSGPHVYELFSVLIHSGSALGGHYYAYIKSVETGKWYNFNDSNVSQISDTEVKTAFGGGNSGGSSYYHASYSTCAYMLMYRLVNLSKNVNVIGPEMIPAILRQKLEEDEAKARRLEQERLEMAKKILLKFYLKTTTSHGTNGKLEKSIHIFRTATMKEALETVCQTFAGLLNEPESASLKELLLKSPSENVRLRGYSEYSDLLSDSYQEKEEKTLTELGFYASQQFYLEVKNPEETWQEYDPYALQFYIRQFLQPNEDDEVTSKKLEELKINTSAKAVLKTLASQSLVYCMQADDTWTISKLITSIRKKWNLSENAKILLVKKNSSSYSSYSSSSSNSSGAIVLNRLTSDETEEVERVNALRLRQDLGLVNGSEVYFEMIEDISAKSLAEKWFEREANLISINFRYLNNKSEKISIDRRKTIKDLKKEIAKRLNGVLPPERFKILRGINNTGVEIKTLDSSLMKLSIGNNHTVFLQEGTPLNVGEYNFRLVLYTPSSQKLEQQREETGLSVISSNSNLNGDEDEEIEGNKKVPLDQLVVRLEKKENEMEVVGQVIVSEEMEVETIRERALVLLHEKNKLEDFTITPSHLRLRDQKQHNVLSHILVNHSKEDKTKKLKLNDVSDLAAYEGRSLNVQILNEPEDLSVDHILVEFIFFDRAVARFGLRKEWILEPPVPLESQKETDKNNGGITQEIVDRLVEEASNTFMISKENLRFAKLNFHQDQVDVVKAIITMHFQTLEQIYDLNSVSSRNTNMINMNSYSAGGGANFLTREKENMIRLIVIDESVRPMMLPHLIRSRLERLISAKLKEEKLKSSSHANKYSYNNSHTNASSSYSSYSSYTPRESALVIRTKSKKKNSNNKNTQDAGLNGNGNSSTDDEEDDQVHHDDLMDDTEMDEVREGNLALFGDLA